MTVTEAYAAAVHADEIVRGCESIDELDEASNFDTATADCPSDFTDGQRRLAQRLILRAYERAIGRV